MSSDELKGITLNTKTLSFVLALMSLASVFWYAVSYLQSQEFRVTAIEQRINAQETRATESKNESKEDYRNLIVKMDAIQKEITTLTISLNGVQIRQGGGANP